MPSWLDNLKGKEEKDPAKEQQELEFKPGEVKERLDKIASLETSMTELKEQNKGISEWVAEQREMKETSRRKEAADKVAKETLEIPDFYTDPDAALNARLAPMQANQINMASIIQRKEVLDTPDFEFYVGDIKKEVDRYIDGLPLSHRADPASIKNCYYTVLGQKHAELKEGKLKSRFSAVSTSASGTGGVAADSKDTVTLTPEQKEVAKIFGMTDEEYVKTGKEFNYV